jgi:hypothetical protein
MKPSAFSYELSAVKREDVESRMIWNLKPGLCILHPAGCDLKSQISNLESALAVRENWPPDEQVELWG